VVKPYFVTPHAVARFRDHTGLRSNPSDEQIVDLIVAALQGPGLPAYADLRDGRPHLIYGLALGDRMLYLVTGPGEGEWPAVRTVLDESSWVHSKLRKLLRHKEKHGRYPMRYWTDEERALAPALQAAGYTIKQIAAIMHRGHMSVFAHVHRLRGHQPAWSIEDLDKAISMRAKGKSCREVGKAVGRTPRAVAIRLYRLRKQRLADPRGRRFAALVGRIIREVRQHGIEAIPDPPKGPGKEAVG